MKLRNKLLLTTAAVLIVATVAQANELRSKSNKGFYVQGNLGASVPVFGGVSIEENENLVGGIALGYQFNDMFRFDVNGAYRNIASISAKAGNDSAKIDWQVTTLFINAYFDIKTSTVVTPYLTLGVGSAVHDIDVSATTKYTSVRAQGTGSTAAWNVGGGTKIKFTDSLSGDIGYRYMDLLAENSNLLTAHEVTAGVILHF